MKMKKEKVKCKAIGEDVELLMFKSKTGEIKFKIVCMWYKGNNKCGALIKNLLRGSDTCYFMTSLTEGEPIIDEEVEEKEEEWEEI
jgi:hypothetical protein